MIKNITKIELRKLMESGDDFLLIDTLSREDFEQIHISGAVNIPSDEMEKWVKENLDMRDKKIVVYCGSYTCQASAFAGEILDKAGFKNVLRYEGGIKEWDESGYPVYLLRSRAA